MVTVRTTAMTMYKNDIEDLIRQRKSVRSYDGNKVSMEQKKELLEFAKDLNNETYEFEIIDIDLAEGVKNWYLWLYQKCQNLPNCHCRRILG